MKKQEEIINNFLINLFKDNKKHIRKKPTKFLKKIGEAQTPIATVVMCSDSRVQLTLIDDNPVGELFLIRNIGNQIKTTLGSVEYGVRILGTGVLIIIGHVQCGAINAIINETKITSENISKELNNLKIEKNITPDLGIIQNIHNQVELALNEFKPEVMSGKLVVIGAIFDFLDFYKAGYNCLITINYNGEQDPLAIQKNNYFKNIDNIKIGLNKK